MKTEPEGALLGHRWRRIEDLPEGWESLADTDLRYLAEYWEEHREEMVSHGAVKDFNERLKREWAIETGLIERIYTLDRGTTEILLERGIEENLISAAATDRDPALVRDIIQDHANALEGLFDYVKGDRELTTSFVKELHSVLLAHQDTASARNTFGRTVEMPLAKGEYKKRPNSPTRPDGLLHQHCPPEQVASEMDRLMEMHARHQEWEVVPEIWRRSLGCSRTSSDAQCSGRSPLRRTSLRRNVTSEPSCSQWLTNSTGVNSVWRASGTGQRISGALWAKRPLGIFGGRQPS